MDMLSSIARTGVAYPFNCQTYTQVVEYAREKGKKLVMFSGSIPVEVLYAMDCVPLGLDMVAAEIAQDKDRTIKLIENAERHLSPNLCGLNKTLIGALLGDLAELKPDAYVFATVMCNSSLAAYYPFRDMIGVPSFSFDMPARRDRNTLAYLSSQFDDFIDFMEKLTGSKLCWDKLKQHMEQVNQNNVLLEECAALRRSKPCPMSAHSVALSGLMAQLSPTEQMTEILTFERNELNRLISQGFSPCAQGEKHRVFLMHNMLRTGSEITGELEKKYSAVTVADGFAATPPIYYEHTDSKAACFMDFTKKLFSPASIHGSSESSQLLVDSAVETIHAFDVDTVLFFGNKGCRHTLAVVKMLTDTVYEKFGLSTLFLDVDSVDNRYKSERDISIAIGEFMDTVINGK